MNYKNIKDIETQYNVKILYMSYAGSRLYGTNNENSDTDMKFIFVPKIEDVLLKKYIDHIKVGIDTKEKNTKYDVDLDGVSIHKFFELLRKGETGAIDILFSMFSLSVMFEDKTFTEAIKENYKGFLNKKLHSFVGYAVGQSAKYGIKGSRYKELKLFTGAYTPLLIDEHWGIKGTDKLETLFSDFNEYFNEKGTKYLKMTTAPGPKTLKEPTDIDYVELLGKKYSGDVTIGYFFERVLELEKQFGNRTKSSAEGVDFKALSHSARVLTEVEELLDTGFIEFPLKNAKYIKSIKEGNELLEDVMEYINERLDIVKEKLDNSDLPEKSNRKLMDEMELIILKEYNL